MGQKQSKDRLLYQYVINCDIEGIHFLSKQGASLEWKDKEGRTPLIIAAKDPRLYGVAQTLIDLGANVNAFCKGSRGGAPLHNAAKEGINHTVASFLPHDGNNGGKPLHSAAVDGLNRTVALLLSKEGSHGGTPLHYAAKEGLDRTVALLLSNGANAFVKDHENRTPLDVARKNGRNLVVREIEGRISYFSGYIREAFGPGLSDASAPEMSSRVIWVVVVPCSLHKPPKRPKLELVIYSTPQDAEPRKIVLLNRSKIKEPDFESPGPSLIIYDKHTKTRYKLSPVTYSDKQQLRRLYNACKGISQVNVASTQMGPEPYDISAQSTISSPNSPGPSTWRSPIRPPMSQINNAWIHESPRKAREYTSHSSVSNTGNQTMFVPTVVPSAPPVITTDQTTTQTSPASSCVVCWDAPVEAACVPCGHVSTCTSCLQEIKENNGVCPVCRARIDQVMKLYGI